MVYISNPFGDLPNTIFSKPSRERQKNSKKKNFKVLVMKLIAVLLELLAVSYTVKTNPHTVKKLFSYDKS